MKKKTKNKQTNWRLSDDARKELDRVSKATGLSKTQVVELCIKKHSAEIEALMHFTKKRVGEFAARELIEGKKKQ